jgi:hypothetical protein
MPPPLGRVPNFFEMNSFSPANEQECNPVRLTRSASLPSSDWLSFLQHAGATIEALQVPKQECDEVVAFVLSLKADIVEAWLRDSRQI